MENIPKSPNFQNEPVNKLRIILFLLYTASISYLTYLVISGLFSKPEITSPSTNPDCRLDLATAFACGLVYSLAYGIARGFVELLTIAASIFIAIQTPFYLIIIFKKDWLRKKLAIFFSFLILLAPYLTWFTMILLDKINFGRPLE